MGRRRHRSVRTSSPVTRRVFRPALSRLEERTLLATVTWASDVSGDWDNQSMWSGDAVPGAADDAVIPFSDITVTHNSSAADSVRSVVSEASLDLSNGSLAIASSSSISGGLTLEGSALSTAGTLTLSGSNAWVGGTISGGAILSIADGATLDIGGYGDNAETLDGVVLENAGTAALADTNPGASFVDLTLVNGAGIDNQASGAFSFPTNFAFPCSAEISSDNSATFFTNEGMLIQPAANPGQASIVPAFTQSDGGTTSVQAGSMSFYGVGTVSGSITGAAGTDLYFDGNTITFSASSSIDTQGSVTFYPGAVATEAGNYDVSHATTVYYDATMTFTAPIADLGSDLNDAGTLNLPGQSFSFTDLTVNYPGHATILNGGGARA